MSKNNWCECKEYLIGTEHKCKAKIAATAEKMATLIASGYAGVLPSGGIVDRRDHPGSLPIQKNALLNAPEPRIGAWEKKAAELGP